MTVTFVHLYKDFETRWPTLRNYAPRCQHMPAPPFGGAGQLFIHDCGNEEGARSSVLFLHANHVRGWGGVLRYELLEQQLGANRLCILPMTTESGTRRDARVPGGTVYGTEAIERLLYAALSERREFRDETQVRDFLRGATDAVLALAILCQGFLAFHASSLSQQGKNWRFDANDLVRKAVESMGWRDGMEVALVGLVAARSGGPAAERRPDGSAQPLPSDPAWWRAVVVAKPEGAALGSASNKPNVKALIDAIFPERVTTDATIPEQTVAEAYQELIAVASGHM